VLRDFAIGKICQTVRYKKDGKLVGRKTVEGWLADLDKKSGNKGNALEQSIDKVIVRKFSGEKQFHDQTARLLVRIVGLHGFPILRGDQFDYSLTLPGEVVETNGQVMSANKLRWQFDGSDAYPLGYVMECRSVLPELEAQENLLQNQPLSDRDMMLQFVALIADREPLRQALFECRKQKKMTPLYDYQRVTTGSDQEEERRATRRLLRLLKLGERSPL
jgi:hypothetical protein